MRLACAAAAMAALVLLVPPAQAVATVYLAGAGDANVTCGDGELRLEPPRGGTTLCRAGPALRQPTEATFRQEEALAGDLVLGSRGFLVLHLGGGAFPVRDLPNPDLAIEALLGSFSENRSFQDVAAGSATCTHLNERDVCTIELALLRAVVPAGHHLVLRLSSANDMGVFTSAVHVGGDGASRLEFPEGDLSEPVEPAAPEVEAAAKESPAAVVLLALAVVAFALAFRRR